MSLIHRLLKKIAPAPKGSAETAPAAPPAAPPAGSAAKAPGVAALPTVAKANFATPAPAPASAAAPAKTAPRPPAVAFPLAPAVAPAKSVSTPPPAAPAPMAPTKLAVAPPAKADPVAPTRPEPVSLPPALDLDESPREEEPALRTPTALAAAREGAHADRTPTLEFSLPTSPVVLPLRSRPTGETAPVPEIAPLSPMRKLNGNRERWIKADPRKAKGPMINVLVVDREQCSCHLVKSILLGCRYSVSIAATIDDANAKVATGLFDVLFVDVGDGTGQEKEFIRKINVDTPHVPVVLVCRDDVPMLADCRTDAVVRKPIRVVKVNEAARHAAALVEKACAESRRRSALRLPVRIQAVDGPAIECVTTGLSVSGVLLEPEGTEYLQVRAFQEFFAGLDRRPVVIDIPRDGRSALKLAARRAFAETSPDQKIRQVGLAIWPVEEEVEGIRVLMGQVA